MRADAQNGFTLIELLVALAIIGVLSAIAIPQYSDMRLRAYVAETATDLRNFKTGFLAYSYLNEGFPNDTHNMLPPEMAAFILPATFNRITPLGGNYNWEGPDFYPYAGISVTAPTADVTAFNALDRSLDDGDLGGGVFRVTQNGRYTYIIEE